MVALNSKYKTRFNIFGNTLFIRSFIPIQIVNQHFELLNKRKMHDSIIHD